MESALFATGLFMIGINCVLSFLPGTMKSEIIAAPFMFFAAAATWHLCGF